MKGDEAMTQDIIVWTLLAGMAGLIWMMALAILGDEHHSQARQKRSASASHSDGYEPNTDPSNRRLETDREAYT